MASRLECPTMDNTTFVLNHYKHMYAMEAYGRTGYGVFVMRPCLA
jgi:hypothetical protein